MYSFDCNIYRKINLRKIRFVSEINIYWDMNVFSHVIKPERLLRSFGHVPINIAIYYLHLPLRKSHYSEL